MSEAIIDVKDLKVAYGKNEVLHGVSLAFPAGDLVALVGPSGCGKSTFLRSLNRMNDEVGNVNIQGTIKFKGQDIYADGSDLVALRSAIGMVFQQPVPFPFSIYDNVSYGLRVAGYTEREYLDQCVEESLRQAAIWDEVKDDLKKSALALSGGQQQRVCIARQLAVRPQVILLDEPTSALDPISSSEIEETLLTLKRDYTLIMVTHNLQQASRISDRTAFFLNGNLVEYGRTEEMFLRPQQEVTSEYLNGRFG